MSLAWKPSRPIGLIWMDQLEQGATLQDIAAKWPEMTVDEIARIVVVAALRYRAATNHDR